MRKLLPLAGLFLLAACDAGDPAAPAEGPFALQIAIDEGNRQLEVRCGGEDATAHRAAAHIERVPGGRAALSLALAVSQQEGTLAEECQARVLVPLRTDALAPGTYAVGETDRALLLYVRETRGGREVFRFTPLTARLRLDRVTEDAVAGHLSVHATTRRGSAAASADFRATLSR